MVSNLRKTSAAVIRTPNKNIQGNRVRLGEEHPAVLGPGGPSKPWKGKCCSGRRTSRGDCTKSPPAFVKKLLYPSWLHEARKLAEFGAEGLEPRIRCAGEVVFVRAEKLFPQEVLDLRLERELGFSGHDS